MDKRIRVANFVTDCVTDVCILQSFRSVGKSFGVTHALGYFSGGEHWLALLLTAAH